MRTTGWYWAKRKYPTWKKTNEWEAIYFNGSYVQTKSASCVCNRTYECDWMLGPTIELPSILVCPICNGMGYDEYDGIDHRLCSRCKGHKYIIKSNSSEMPWDKDI